MSVSVPVNCFVFRTVSQLSACDFVACLELVQKVFECVIRPAVALKLVV